jgi:hypothetical protein
MRTRPHRYAWTLAAALALTGIPLALAPAASAAASDVVISELMYHAPDTDPLYADVEFIELTNTGSSAVDVGGWSFTNGITLATADQALPAGLTMPAGGRIVGTNDTALFQAKYGFAADFSYAGTALSNGGEEVTLVDASATTVDDVTYDDAAPWPVAPDGYGPSLEVSDLAVDNADPANWHASSVDFGTPRQPNTTPPLALADETVTPAVPDPGQSAQISASAPVGSTMTLAYKVMYGSEVTVPMLDDAASPGGAGDGVYAATVPGAAAGQMVRYRIAAAKGGLSADYPPVGDSRPYDGYVVHDPALGSAQYPVLQWFMPDATYQDLLAHHRCDDVTANATFYWNGVLLDGGAMKIKGHHTCGDAKVKWNIELPAGYTFDFGDGFFYPVDEFNLESNALPIPQLGWEMIGQTGAPTAGERTMRVQRNGAFFGVFGVLEKYDGTWRKAHGYKDAAFYKVQAKGLKTYATAADLAASGDIDKKNPDDGDFTDIWTLTQELALPDTPAKQAWLHEHLDLSEIANYTAVTVAMRQWDSGGKNYYVVANPDTGRWQVLSWDLDGIFNGGRDNKGDFVFPTTSFSKLWSSLFAMDDFRAMHYRRVRTLADQFLTGNGLVDRFDQLSAAYSGDLALDKQAWGGWSLTTGRNRVVQGVQERRDQIAAHTNATEIPTSQSGSAVVVINELQYNPAPGGAEFFEVYNPSGSAVDMSGWTESATGYTFPPGTVVPGHAYAAFVDSDADLVAAYGGDLLMLGQYPGGLSGGGEEVTIADGARVVDTVTYGPSDPWPTEPDGGGPSLELIDPASDNALPSSWAASTGTGTPGAQNSVFGGGGGGGTSTVLDYHSTWRYLSTSADQGTGWRAGGFDDSSWPTGAGALGCLSTQDTTIACAKGRKTYYFRTTVTVPAGPAVTAASLGLKVDDGAIVYLDGVEVGRTNMPSGTINYKTRASSNVKAVSETTLTLPSAALTVGSHSLAVEVHQYRAGSTADLYFDATAQITR